MLSNTIITQIPLNHSMIINLGILEFLIKQSKRFPFVLILDQSGLVSELFGTAGFVP